MAQQTTLFTAPPTEAAPTRTGSRAVLWLGLIVLFSGAVRALLVGAYDFPLSDGGLVYTQVLALLDNNFVLPQAVTYNGYELPFADPPLALYLVAGLHRLTSWPVLDLLRWLPVALTTATIPVMFLALRAYFASDRMALLGTLAFAATPSTVYHLLAGGGAPGAAGMFFAALATWQAILQSQKRSLWSIGAALVWVALAILSDFSWGIVSLIMFTAVVFFSERSLLGAVRILALPGVLLLLTPWLFTVFRYHGLAPYLDIFFAQLGTNPPLAFLTDISATLTLETAFPVLWMMAILGILVALAQGHLLLTAWMVLALLVLPHSPHIATLFPISFFLALALDSLVLRGIGSFRRGDGRPVSQWVSLLTVVVIIGFPVLDLVVLQQVDNTSALTPVSAESREAMAWAEANLPPNSTFVLLTPADDPQEDAFANWFPVLTSHRSLNTVTGTMWLPNNRGQVERVHHQALRDCLPQRVACLEAWALVNTKPYQYVWAGAGAQGRLIAELGLNLNYARVYDDNDITIFAR